MTGQISCPIDKVYIDGPMICSWCDSKTAVLKMRTAFFTTADPEYDHAHEDIDELIVSS